MNKSAFRILTALSVLFMVSCARTSPVGMDLAPGGAGSYNGHTRISVPTAARPAGPTAVDEMARAAKPWAAGQINKKLVENGIAPIPGLFPQNTGGSSANGEQIINRSAITDRMLNKIFD